MRASDSADTENVFGKDSETNRSAATGMKNYSRSELKESLFLVTGVANNIV